jgi:catechol 2,3-dioxygenase-like lactoylglutathione lyase family enzyme
MALVKLSKERHVHHVGLRVLDAAAAKSWYLDTFDLDVDREFSYNDLDIIFLRGAGQHPLIIEIIGGGDVGDPTPLEELIRHPGFSHLCMQVDDIEKAMSDLRARGVQIFLDVMDGAAGSGIQKGSFIIDPWGNPIELVQVLKSA